MAEIHTPPRRLVDLKPRWMNHSAYSGRDGLASFAGNTMGGISFACPCLDPACADNAISFENPLIGEPWPHSRTRWQRTGETFETLTLSPSVWYQGHWHGWIRDGMLISV